MSNRSRRRVTTAAGAILASAAVSITVASSAWAVTGSGEGTPTPPSDCTGPCVAAYDAAVTAYDINGTPASVSYDGTNVYTSPGDPATAYTPPHSTGDVALAIGDGSDASILSGNNDTVYADGGGTTSSDHDTATVVSGSNDNVTAGGSSTSANDTATVWGGNSDVVDAVTGSHDTSTVFLGSYDTAGAGLGNGDTVGIIGSTDYALATGTSDTVFITGSNDGTASSPDQATGGNDSLRIYGNGYSDVDVTTHGTNVTEPHFLFPFFPLLP